ncbi:MAG: BLUF domain-containing protein [Pseudomonadota bacterium]
MSLQCVVYMSTSVGDPSADDLRALLETARQNNAPLQLTGMLLYHDRTYIQALEGPPASVAKVYERITVDKRHTGLLKLIDRRTDERDFADWTMGFNVLSDAELRSVESWFPLNAFGSQARQLEPGSAYRLLTHFHSRLAA